MIEIRVLTYNDIAPVVPIAGIISGNDGTVGRAENNTIVLPDPWNMVSRQHLKFSLQPGGVYKVKNINDDNVVFINGEKLKSGTDHQLSDYDKISVAAYVLEVRYATQNDTNTLPSSLLSTITTDTPMMKEVSDDLLTSLFGVNSCIKNNSKLKSENDNLLDIFMQQKRAFIQGDPARILNGHAIELCSLDGKADELINDKSDKNTTIHQLLHDSFSDSIQQLYYNESNDPLISIDYETNCAGDDVFADIVQIKKNKNLTRINLVNGSELSGLFYLPESNLMSNDLQLDSETEVNVFDKLKENFSAKDLPKSNINCSEENLDIDQFFLGIIIPNSSVSVQDDTFLESTVISEYNELPPNILDKQVENISAKNSFEIDGNNLEEEIDVDQLISEIVTPKSLTTADDEAFLSTDALDNSSIEEFISETQLKFSTELIEKNPVENTDINLSKGMSESRQSAGDYILPNISCHADDNAFLQSTLILDQEEHIKLQTAKELTLNIDIAENVLLPEFSEVILNDIVSANAALEEPRQFISDPTLADVSVVVSLSMTSQPTVMAQMAFSSQQQDQLISEKNNEVDTNEQYGVEEIYNSILESISNLEANASQASMEKLFQAFCEGLGVDIPRRTVLDEEFMKFLGQLLRSYTQGTLEMVAGRVIIKQELRANVTVIAPERNNPLKFSPNTEAALLYLMGKSLPGFLEPLEAIQNIFVDLCAHQIGIVTGTKTALSHVFDNFDPALIAANKKQKSLLFKALPLWRKARLWEEYENYFNHSREDLKDHFQDFYGFVFLKAYMEAINMMQTINTGVEGEENK